jgi:CRP/FNR family transcriptional regulator, dissimilatory nitrate respiration regulator
MKHAALPPSLAALPPRLRACAVPLAAAAGDIVFRRGSRPARVFLVLEGEVRLVRSSPGGAEIVLQRSSSGFLAEASLEAPRYHCDAIAAADSRLLAFPIGPFREALRRDATFRTFWMARLAREVRLLRSQNERLSLRSAAERIEHYMEAEGEQGRLELKCSRKAWAAELGLTHEVLYRTLAGLQRSGRLTASKSAERLTLTLTKVKSPAR